MIHASLRNYRSILLAFRMNSLISIPFLVKRHLPLLLVPTELLLVILDRVSFRQTKSADLLTLALLASNSMFSYDFRLLADAITVSERLLLALNILLASQ